MSDAQTPVDHLARISELEAEIDEALLRRDLAADGDERSDGHHHMAEAATDAELRERQLREQLKLQAQRDRLRLAREAVAAGTYGVCVDCAEPIPEGRLRARPDATRCVPCQTLAARRR